MGVEHQIPCSSHGLKFVIATYLIEMNKVNIWTLIRAFHQGFSTKCEGVIRLVLHITVVGSYDMVLVVFFYDKVKHDLYMLRYRYDSYK